MKSIVSGAVCLVVGLGIGALFVGSTSSAPSVEKPIARTADKGAGMSRMEMAAIVREELARERGAPPVVVARATQTQTETLEEARERMTAEQAENADRAAKIVEDAVARGTWTEQNKRDLWAALGDVPGPMQREVFQSLGIAINNNRLRIETEGSPL